MCLNAERYSALSRTLQNSSRGRISTHTRNILYIIGAWRAALGVMTTLFISLLNGDLKSKMCITFIDFLILILGVPICMTGFNVLTSRLLKQECSRHPWGRKSSSFASYKVQKFKGYNVNGCTIHRQLYPRIYFSNYFRLKCT